MGFLSGLAVVRGITSADPCCRRLFQNLHDCAEGQEGDQAGVVHATVWPDAGGKGRPRNSIARFPRKPGNELVLVPQGSARIVRVSAWKDAYDVFLEVQIQMTGKSR